MIVVSLKGGLGNQFFQYALGRQLSLKHNCPLFFDLSFFKTTPDRHFELKKFNTVGTPIPSLAVKLIKKYGASQFLKKIGQDFLFLKEQGTRFNPELLQLEKKNLYLNGYWQTERYFKSIRNTLLKELQPIKKLDAANQKIKQAIKNANSVAIHIRRGDYVNNPKTNSYHGTCSPAYYQRAIQFLNPVKNKLHFFIFSDDLAWAKNNLKIQSKVTFVDLNSENTDYQDLILMSHCQHFIIANSSFSWWAAWLSSNPTKKVIAPQSWFQEADEGDLIPQSWIRL